MSDTKNKKKSKSVGKVVTGIAIGGAIGSLLGVVFAPRKGEETRKIIKNKSQDLYTKGKDLYEKHSNLEPSPDQKPRKCCILTTLKKLWKK